MEICQPPIQAVSHVQGLAGLAGGKDERVSHDLRLVNGVLHLPAILTENVLVGDQVDGTGDTGLDEEFGVLRGEIETTSGPRQLEIRGYRTHVRMLSGGRAIIEDVDGNRYLIEDWRALPQHTREILGL